jgi:hypothetical protein
MLGTHGVRDPPILERLTLGHHIDPTFGLAPGTGDNHARGIAAP